MNTHSRGAHMTAMRLMFVIVSLGCASASRAESPSSDRANTTQRDGARDFDFEFGSWKTHIRRLVHPLSGSTEYAEYDGTTVVTKLWNGDAHIVELDVKGPAGRIQGLSLRLYNSEAKQWSMNFVNRRSGVLATPAVGEFSNGRGEFHDQETFDGRVILVRSVWSDITPESARFEQSFSADGGKTWEVNWSAIDTRIPDAPAKK